MSVAQIGTTLDIGAGTITGSYIVEGSTDDDKNVESEDIDDENGELATRIVFKKHAKQPLELIALDGALPGTDFPKGEMCAHTDFTTWFVEDARSAKSKSAKRVSVELVNLGIT